MSKLVVRSGRIEKETRFEADRMNVLFRRAAISTSGDLGAVLVEIGSDRVEMTYAQALSLAGEIMRRCQ
jgi:hypothetical protein